MSLPDAASLEALSLAELRELVGALASEVSWLRALGEAQQASLAASTAENQALRDEVARRKGLPPPPPPSRPSGMEQAAGGAGSERGGRRSRRRRGAKRDRKAVTAEVVVKAAPPPGSRFKGYQDILVRELTLTPEVVRYRRECRGNASWGRGLAAGPAGPPRRARAGAGRRRVIRVD